MRIITVSLFLICNLFFFGADPSNAQPLYVSDEIRITVRSGPSTENKVIAVLPTGTKLEVVEEQEDWLLVRSDTEKEGWILKRFTSEEIPKKTQIEGLQKKLDRVSKKLQATTEKASKVEKENKELSQTLTSTQKDLNTVKSNYSTLASDSKNVLDLKKKYEDSAAGLIEFMSVTDQLRQENAALRSTTNTRWFLSGAGVVSASLLVGFIIGRIKRGRQRVASFF